MNKIAEYLNVHLVGEVMTNDAVREAYSTDGSVLSIKPEMVAFVRKTNDIRKVTRFAWQLAEKGHVLGVTARGSGGDVTGAAIGSGVVMNLAAHMNMLFEYDAKQKLVRLQPGATIATVQNALSLHGTGIAGLMNEHSNTTLGGVVAGSRRAVEYVDQLEMVLANGDVMQTQRLSRRELGKKKGEQSFEGEIYRKLDALIDENEALINEIQTGESAPDHFGYAAIAEVRQKNGSFDLTPLIAGSQGTLGIISEMIVKADFINQTPAIAVATFTDDAEARDAIDALERIGLTTLTYVDGAYIASAGSFGKTYEPFAAAKGDEETVAAALIMTVNDFSSHARHKKLKKIQKALKSFKAEVTTNEDETASDLDALFSLPDWHLNPDAKDAAAPALCDGFSVPLARLEEFRAALAELGKKHHIELPLYGRPLEGVWFTRPHLRLSTVGDKQKVFKLSRELIELVQKYGGVPFVATGEGRLQAHQAALVADEPVQELYRQVKEIFDPMGILNPGVKQPTDVRTTAKLLRSNYTASASTGFVAKF